MTGFQRITGLKASHIKPWSASADPERLDPYNGFLLLPNLDTLFDPGLISFENTGRMMVSSRLTETDRRILSLRHDSRLRRVFPENAVYLEQHRGNFFHG